MIFKAMLDLLDKNRYLPNYSVERRVDLLINLFLEDILTAFYSTQVRLVVPELSLRKESNNRSDKLDYLCVFAETKQPIFVELKTDAKSFDPKQASMYLKHSASWPKCVDKLKEIVKASGYRVKYFRLISKLLDAGLITLTDEGDGKLIEDLSTLSGKLVTQSEKIEFSRKLIRLSDYYSASWPNEVAILYLVPNDENLKKQVHSACEGKAEVLDFAQIDNMIKDHKIDPNMKNITEFQELIEFLNKPMEYE